MRLLFYFCVLQIESGKVGLFLNILLLPSKQIVSNHSGRWNYRSFVFLHRVYITICIRTIRRISLFLTLKLLVIVVRFNVENSWEYFLSHSQLDQLSVLIIVSEKWDWTNGCRHQEHWREASNISDAYIYKNIFSQIVFCFPLTLQDKDHRARAWQRMI